jgi:hypothetical protein
VGSEDEFRDEEHGARSSRGIAHAKSSGSNLDEMIKEGDVAHQA